MTDRELLSRKFAVIDFIEYLESLIENIPPEIMEKIKYNDDTYRQYCEEEITIEEIMKDKQLLTDFLLSFLDFFIMDLTAEKHAFEYNAKSIMRKSGELD